MLTELAATRARIALRAELAGLRARRIAVVHGGLSAEDRLNAERFPVEEWSLTPIMQTMRQLGLTAVHLDPTSDRFVDAVREHDLVFLNVHGPYGEDGRIQGLLDYLQLAYTTSGVLAGCVGADKLMTKAVCARLSIRTPADRSIDPVVEDDLAVRFPAMLKASAGGTSLGVVLVEDEHAVRGALVELRLLGYARCFLEEYVRGRSLTIGLLDLPGGTMVLPPLEAVARRPFYDRATKFSLGADSAVRFHVPEDLPAEVVKEMAGFALRLFRHLGCRGAARVDFVVAGDTHRPHLLEINTVPGFHPRGNLALAAAAAGLDHQDLVLALLAEAAGRSNPPPWRPMAS